MATQFPQDPNAGRFIDGLRDQQANADEGMEFEIPDDEAEIEELPDGSAIVRMDTKGPTVTLQSIARATCHIYKEHREDLINMKMSPASVAGEEGTRRLMQLIRVWSSQKHAHIQFNILNKQTLLAAQKNPEKYRDLVVRIAGYCAYFVDLTPSQQAEIIARTEEQLS